ncbi:MAG: flavin reductase family protein [Actinobacteria bacterium]|nr:flavin reductase family protein [Actinomycetota bacterium]
MLNTQMELTESTLAQSLIPRLTVVITTIDPQGVFNASPYSFFSPLSYVPPRVCFATNGLKHTDYGRFHLGDGEPSAGDVVKMEKFAGETTETVKDTLVNVMEQGEFGVNVLSIDYLSEMCVTDGAFPRGVDELKMAGLTPYRATKIKPPLIREAQFALECVKVGSYDLDSGERWLTLVIGEGVAAHVDSAMVEDGMIVAERINSILQFHGPLFGVCTNTRFCERSRYGKVLSLMETR